MKKPVKRIECTAVCVFVALFILGSVPIRAQTQDATWSAPYRLSGKVGQYVEMSNVMIADPYGFVHGFWVEEEMHTRQFVIMHAQFDGEVWDFPVDVYVTSSADGPRSLSPSLDSHGVLHLAWTEGNQGPVNYSTVPAHRANSAAEWSPSMRIYVPAHQLELEAGANGVLHLVYTEFYGAQRGVYYTRSVDGARTWSPAVWLDPDILPDHSPIWLEFVLDKDGGLHVVWQYLNQSKDTGDSVHYIQSSDGGISWSQPLTIDEPDESEGELRLADPGLIIQDRMVHVIYAGDEMTHREHRYSRDAGQTWSPVAAIFGELHGQAQGEGLAVDALGRIHYVGHIRYPQGLYHAFWDAGYWSHPNLFYEIDRNSSDPLTGGIHVHSVRVAMRAGSQLVVSFYDRDANPFVLYAMHHTLAGVPALQTRSTPEAASPEPTPPPVQQIPMITSEILDKRIPTTQNEVSASRGQGDVIWLSVGPTLLLLVVVGIMRAKGRIQ